MEDVNINDIEEPVVKNGAHYTQEHQESDLNYTELDGKTWEMSNQKNESEVIIPSNQQEVGRFVCSECNVGFSLINDLLNHNRSKHKEVRNECDQCDFSSTDKH